MTVSGMTKDVTSTKELILVVTMVTMNQTTCLMITLMMVKLVPTSKSGSLVMRNLPAKIGMAVVIPKHSETPTIAAIGMAKNVRMNFGSIATGKKKKTAHGCPAKTQTTSEDSKRAKILAIKKLRANFRENQEMLTLMSSIFRCSSTALGIGFRSKKCALEDSSATAMSE